MKRNHRIGNGNTLRVSAILATAITAVLLTGCGGGGTSRVVSKTPTKATKAHVQSVQILSLRNMAQSGVPNGTFTAMRGGIAPLAGAVSAVAGSAANGGASTNTAALPVPLLGQFLHNVGSTSITSRTKAIRAMMAHQTTLHGKITRVASTSGSSGGVSGSSGTIIPVDPPVPIVMPTFYYDDYLGLWVDINDTATTSTYTLYQDQAKTQPAGSIITNFPAADTFPQIFSSTYSYTAGSQAGSGGKYNSTYNADNSGSSSYVDIYSDGSKDQGSSSSTANGDYTWTGRTDNADKSYISMSGTFHDDGSGATRTSGSDGYASNFTYNADGSGHGRVTGPDAGLPATIVWDALGNTTITYADGTADFIPGWGYGVAVPVTTTNVSSTTTTAVTAPVPPTAPATKK